MFATKFVHSWLFCFGDGLMATVDKRFAADADYPLRL